jgi:hypothetical protein
MFFELTTRQNAVLQTSCLRYGEQIEMIALHLQALRTWRQSQGMDLHGIKMLCSMRVFSYIMRLQPNWRAVASPAAEH